MGILGDSLALKINVLEITTLSQTKTQTSARGEHNYIELPSIEQIVNMDQQRSEAIASLEISKNQTKVRCQGSCGMFWPIINMKDDSMLTTSSGKSGRIARLQTMIRYAEKYRVGSCKKEKEELKDLLAEERQRVC